MAKIKSVSLKSIPESIHVGDNVSDITILTNLEFHPLDISLQMEYMLYLFVYDVHGKPDVPIILSNWDDSVFMGMQLDGKDDLLGRKVVSIVANSNPLIETPIALKLGNLNDSHSCYKRKLEVFATLIPAIGKASKWSEPFEASIVF
ncbi:hypothetical protein [Mariniflexile sp. AS56]|uniref:hypothetical protein n=1 Tax=Mariniflexile sp. AS56 TaxID=3063957 RepID=UPI0026E9E3C0|nr:hypothetical protein [Mariniflexile sp. AS56]MDO7173584.1 hypothetical protein [Mariniflexile sp. AS56]